MQEPADTELLSRYVERASEAAFAALVTRHVNVVYSVGLRKTGNPHAAEEIAQAVFILLAKKAASLSKETVLAGWLYQTARLTAANYLRNEIRRVRREQEAYMQSPAHETETWLEIEPLLDDAMGCLGEKERSAIVLRYFQGRSFQEIGTAFGGSENAAKKRVIHGLEKLRKFFAKRGVVSTATAIGGALSVHSAQAAPALLAQSVTAVAVVKGSTAAASTMTLVEGTMKTMTWLKLKLAFATAAIVLVAGGAVTAALSDNGDKTPPPAAGNAGSFPTNILIAAEFYEVPDNALADINIQGQAMTSKAATILLTRAEHNAAVQMLKKNPAVSLISRPSIIFDGSKKDSRGTVSMANKPVEVGGTNAETGITLEVEADASDPNGRALGLSVAAEWRELVDVSARQDGSQHDIRTTKATASETVAINPSQTILIEQPVNNQPQALGQSAGPKTLLVFVTPMHVAQRLQRLSTQPAAPK